MPQHVRITLAATSLNRSVDFYRHVLDLPEAERIGDVWARFQLGTAELWLVPGASPIAGSGTVSAEVHRWLEDILYPVEEMGGQALSPIEDELTGRVVRIRDPDGNLVTLLQPAVTEVLLCATDRAVGELEALVRETPEDVTSRRPRPKEPSVTEVAAHVLDRGFRFVDDIVRLEGDEERFKAEWDREASLAKEGPKPGGLPSGTTAEGILREINAVWARVRPRLPRLEPTLAAYRVPVGSPPGYSHTVVERIFVLLPNHTSRHVQQIRDILARLPK